MSVFGLGDFPDFPDPVVDAKEIQKLVKEQIERDSAAQIVKDLRALDTYKDFDVLLPDQLYAVERPSVKFRVANLAPTDATILLTAQAKAGKTTLDVNLTYSLVTGEPFLGKYAVRPLVDGEDFMLIINNELEAWQYADELELRGVPRGHGMFGVANLRDRTSSLNLLDRTIRRKWIEKLNTCGPDGRPVTMLKLDPLGPMLRAMGRDENSNTEVGPVMDLLNELRAETSIREIFIIHHTGHGGGEGRTGGARGASVLSDVPTALWDYRRENADDQWSPRIFSATGRSGVKAAKEKILFSEDDRRLFVEGSDKATSIKVGGKRVVSKPQVVTEGVA